MSTTPSLAAFRSAVLRFRLAGVSLLLWGLAAGASAASGDIVLYATDVTTLRGNWATAASSTAAGGQMLASADRGWTTSNSPLAVPADYVEATFAAPSYTPYHVWVRLRAAADSKYNDSVWLQFSDALDLGQSAVYAIGSTRGLLLNLENCSGCGDSGWGWQDKAYWLQQSSTVQFSTSGPHTIRIQTREDGVQFDQIVLSPATYFSGAPGPVVNDATIVPKSSAPTPSTSTSTSISSPYSGSPAALPGRIAAERFDAGGEGVAYHDTTPGNSGGQARSTDVDIEASTDGGYDVGWTAPGEWLKYTVNVAAAGSYTLQLRVASPNSSALHVAFDAPAGSVSTAVGVPATGGWQAWATVSVPVTLAGGTQGMTLTFDTGGLNLGSITAVNATTSTTPPAAAAGPYSGTAAAIPGNIRAETFDTGGEGIAYHDTTAGNSGGAFRATDVDLEASSGGGYDVGWTAAGEWLNYTVNVAASGSYTAQLRVASPSGATMHVGFNTASNVWVSVAIPATGGWQNWTTVTVPVTLAAGVQQMTLLFDTPGLNFNSVTIAAPASSTGGTVVSAVTWNIQVDDASETHARVAMDMALATSPRPQVIAVQEAQTAQFAAYLDELQKQTGQVWHGVFAPLCGLGQWTGTTCAATYSQGVAIFTSFNIVNSDAMFFPYADCWQSARAGLRAAVDVNGTVLQVFTTHLQHTSGCADDALSRAKSMSMLKTWAAGYSTPQIVGGDFNGQAGEVDTTSGMYPNFADVWTAVGSGAGLTAYLPTPTIRIDYWFTDASMKATPQTVEVIQNTGTVSDHLPVKVTIKVP